MVRRKWNTVVFAALASLIVSCNQKPVDVLCDLPPISEPGSRSNDLVVNIYIDGTPSMEGYVATNKISRYAQTIDLLESTFFLNSQGVKYNRLGTNSTEISREQFRKDAKLPKFYNGKDGQYKPLPVSQIEGAVALSTQGNHLSVIITDLYQQDNDVTTISKKIETNYLENPENAVGLLAIKSEFKGSVYTENTKFPKFDYSTDGKKTEEYHPFYVIFLGKYSDISYFFDKLTKEGGELIKESKSVVFSPKYLIQKPLHFSSKTIKNGNIKRPFSLDNKKVFVKKNKEDSLDLLEIGKDQKTELNLPYKVDLNYFAHTLLFEANSLQPKVKTQDLDPFNANKSNPSLQQALTVDGFNINKPENQVSFNTKIQSSQIEAGIYSFTVDIMATDLQEQAWWQEWNSTDANITDKDGSRTYNLEKFLRELKNITIESMIKNNNKQAPILGRFCYAIQKN